MKFFNSMFAAAEMALMPSKTKLLLQGPSSPKLGFDLPRIASDDIDTPNDDIVVPGPFLRDFDENPTDLYRFIQMQRWGRVMEVINKAPEEAKIWVFRTEEDHIGLRWRLLPLHAALIVSILTKYRQKQSSKLLTSPSFLHFG